MNMKTAEANEADILLSNAKNGDIQAFTELFREFQPKLKSYLYRLTANRNDTEDLAQDTFILAFENIKTFRSESSLKSWVFTIATHHALKHIKSKKRWTPETFERTPSYSHEHDVISKMLHTNRTSPQGAFEIREHIDYCFTCVSKMLPIEEQVTLILKDVYDFKVEEISNIVGQSFGAVKHSLHDGRKTMMEVFDKKCALVSKQGTCHQCSRLNGMFNPKQRSREQLMKIRMVRDGDGKTKQQLYKLRAELAREINPLEANGAELHELMMGVNHIVNEQEVEGEILHKC
jgi:RNA polymerase sigma-70 factor, ECF subfamily